MLCIAMAPADQYTPTAPIGARGWAIQRVGPWVLGHWEAPLNEARVLACRDLYRQARQAHGRFAVLACFTGHPFELDLVLAGRTRAVVVALFKEFRPTADALIFPLEGTGIQAAIMRAAAARVLQALPMRMPIHFPSNVEEGLAVARRLGLHPVVPEAVLRTQMAFLRERALIG